MEVKSLAKIPKYQMMTCFDKSSPETIGPYIPYFSKFELDNLTNNMITHIGIWGDYLFEIESVLSQPYIQVSSEWLPSPETRKENEQEMACGNSTINLTVSVQ